MAVLLQEDSGEGELGISSQGIIIEARNSISTVLLKFPEQFLFYRLQVGWSVLPRIVHVDCLFLVLVDYLLPQQPVFGIVLVLILALVVVLLPWERKK